MPLIRRQPKLGGFKSPRTETFEVVNIATLEKKLPAGKYTIQDLLHKHVIKKGTLVKVLATGAVSKKFDLEVHAASKAAKKAIKDAGGSINLIK